MAVSLVEAQVELEELASGSVFKNCDRHRDFIVFHRANLLLDWHVDGLDWNLVLRHGLVETEVEVLLPVPVSVVLDLDIVVDDSTAGALQHGVRVAHDLSTLHHVLRLALLVRSVSSIVLVVLAMLEASFVVQEVLNFFLAETVVAAQVGYDFSGSGIDALYGLSVLFQVNNLTNEPFTSYTGDDARHVRDYQNYGRNFMLGANYKF